MDSYLGAFHIFQKFDFVRTGTDAFTEHNLSKVLGGRLGLINRTEIEMVELEGDHRFLGVQPVNVENNIRLCVRKKKCD